MGGYEGRSWDYGGATGVQNSVMGRVTGVHSNAMGKGLGL